MDRWFSNKVKFKNHNKSLLSLANFLFFVFFAFFTYRDWSGVNEKSQRGFGIMPGWNEMSLKQSYDESVFLYISSLSIRTPTKNRFSLGGIWLKRHADSHPITSCTELMVSYLKEVYPAKIIFKKMNFKGILFRYFIITNISIAIFGISWLIIHLIVK